MTHATHTNDSGLLQKLNTAQREAVTSTADTLAILAGPGSGKTHTLTARVTWLIDHVGYRPCNVIVATFTVKAAREMKERIGKALGEERAKKIVLGTFHSIARRYLVVYGDRIGLNKKFAIADDADTRAIIKRICKRLGLKLDPAHAKGWISKKKVRLPGDTPDASGGGKLTQRDEELQRAFDEYEEHMRRSNLLDYDDLLVRGVELLQKHPSCVRNVQVVLVDEYQDTNGIQYELTKLLASARNRITVVGDPDQSIYGWRSAEIKNLENLLKQYPRTVKVPLEENYRSSRAILEASLEVIQQDEKRFKKELKATHHTGTRPVFRTLESAQAEGEWIVGEIRRAIAMAGGMLKHDDIAILLRSAFLSRHIESALGKGGVPYRMVGGLKFYERVEIKLILDYLRVVYQPNNNDALARIINTPKRGVGEATLKKLLDEAEASGRSLWNTLLEHFRGQHTLQNGISKAAERNISGGLVRLINSLRYRLEPPASSARAGSSLGLVELVEELINQLDLKKHIEALYPEEHEARLANVDELVILVGDFVRDQDLNEEILPQLDDDEDTTEDTNILGKFLSNVALAASAQSNDNNGDDKPLVTISTIHAAKGLEWPIVFVPAVYNGSLPHVFSEDRDEERRLLYVAMTRAQALLYLSVPWYSNGKQVERSDFVPDETVKRLALSGPSFEQGMLETVGKILGRSAPSMKETFARLPEMFAIEDNTKPDFPHGYTRPEGIPARPSSRAPKRGGNWSGRDPLAHERNQMPWQKEYATTMEQASSFTTALPGFTTAGAHHSLLKAAGAPAASGGKGTAPGRRIGGSTNRPANQGSLASFVRREPGLPPARKAEGPHLPQRIVHAGQVGQSFNQPLPQSLATEMTHRELQSVKRRVMKRRSDVVVDLDADEPAPKKGKYPGFSSSPPRPASPEKENVVSVAAKVEAEERRMGFRGPASLHATTMGRVGKGPEVIDLTKDGEVEGLAPVERLRRPFKPLTINRNGNFARQ